MITENIIDSDNLDFVTSDLEVELLDARNKLISIAKELQQQYWHWWKSKNNEVLEQKNRGGKVNTGKMIPRVRVREGRGSMFWEKAPRITATKKTIYGAHIKKGKKGHTKEQFARIGEPWEWDKAFEYEMKFAEIRQVLSITQEALNKINTFNKQLTRPK